VPCQLKPLKNIKRCSMNKIPAYLPELIFNFLILILGLVIVIGSIKLGFLSLNHQGPGLFSFFAGATIVVSEIIIIFFSHFRKKKTKIQHFFKKNDLKILAGMIIFFVSWIIVMPFFGYILVTFLATFAFAKILGLDGWLKPFMLSAETSILVYILFDRLLYLDLPRGLFF